MRIQVDVNDRPTDTWNDKTMIERVTITIAPVEELLYPHISKMQKHNKNKLKILADKIFSCSAID